MKLFKKALLATAIFGAMGAQAADVSDAVDFTSVEGFAVANGVLADDTKVRVIVREKLEAGDKVTLQFGAGFDLTNPAFVLAQAATAGANEIAINNGTADYTFTLDAAESDFANGKVVMTLDTGYTVELDESFEIIADPTVLKATATEANAIVTYSAARWQDGVAKDTGGDNTGTFLKFANQYGATVATLLDGKIERVSQSSFVTGGVVAPVVNNDADTFSIALTDKINYVNAVAAATTAATIEIAGDFSDIVVGDIAISESGNLAAGDVVATSVTSSLLTLTVTDTAADGNSGSFTVTIDNGTRIGAGETIKESTFVADATVDYGHTVDATILTNASVGEWVLDATIINVPYFPVGFDGVSTSVHFANEGSTDVNVIMTAIDENGKVYDAVNMGDLAADTVTKYTQTLIMKELGITSATKISVTFNIDATEGVVNAYAFSNAGTGRQSLVTSQQKGK